MLQIIDGPFIEAGEALSNAIDCRGGQLVRITMPMDWTEAPLTFEFSTDGTGYNDMFDLKGYAVTIDVVVPGSGVIIPEDVGRAVGWIKFRSGTRGNPVEQKEGRLFAVAIVADEAAPPASRSKKRLPSEMEKMMQERRAPAKKSAAKKWKPAKDETAKKKSRR